MHTTTRWTARLLLPLALLALGTAACSGDDDEGATDDVATLGAGDTDTDADTDTDDEAGGGQGARQVDPEFQDAMLEFAECMRDHGVDMPDPSFEEGGGAVIIGGAAAGGEGGPPSEAEMAEVEEAQEACQPILDEVEGSMPQLDPEQQAEMQDQALAFAQCMREHGIDMPDPTFGEGGRIEQRIGGPEGVDFSDEDFQEAQEACREEGGMDGPGVVMGGGPGVGTSSSGSAEVGG